MPVFTIPDLGTLAFLDAFFGGGNGTQWGVAVDLHERNVSTEDVLLHRMVERANANVPFALPFVASDTDHWIITGGKAHELDVATLHIERALIPSFGAFLGSDATASRLSYDPRRNAFQEKGAQRFPHGYYTFGSPRRYRNQVRARLERWTKLEEQRPSSSAEDVPTYANRVARFHAATAASQWSEAEIALEDLDRFNLCSAENLRFLRIELLARQGLWSQIWGDSDRRRIVELRLPRAVRAALLTAFYITVIEPVEQAEGIEAALMRYKAERSLLGNLMMGRFGLDQPAVVVISGYEEVIAGSHAGLARLMEGTAEPALGVLERLSELLPTGEPPSEQTDARKLVREALQFGDLEAAIVHADDLADPVHRLAARIEIAALSADAPLSGEVLREYVYAVSSMKQALHTSAPGLDAHIALLFEASNKTWSGDVPAPPGAQWQVNDWGAWLSAAIREPDHPEARKALDRVSGSFVRSFTGAGAGELSNMVQQVFVEHSLAEHSLFREAVRLLANDIIADSAFPRASNEADDLHESVLECFFGTAQRNGDSTLTILALLDALLAHRPERIGSIPARLCAWFAYPIPALEPRALDAFELLIDYGARQDQLAQSLREWTQSMLEWPRLPEESRLAVWEELVRWSGSAPDLLANLRDRRVKGADDQRVDPLLSLPDGFHIVIFTLRPASAERAVRLLHQRNPKIRTSVCDAKTLNDRAKHLARIADLPVVVTRAASHALTEGIRPHLAHPELYPPSAGASGILQAISLWAENVQGP